MSEVKYKVKEGLTKDMFKASKWYVSDWTFEQKAVWQEFMFELGFSWNNRFEVSHLGKTYYYLGEALSIMYGDIDTLFEEDYYLQKHFSDVFDIVKEEETSTDDVLIINGVSSHEHLHAGGTAITSAPLESGVYNVKGKPITDVDEDPLEKVGLSSESKTPHKSDGGKSKYYEVVLPQRLLDKQAKDGYIMIEDLAEVMFDNDFNFTNVFKAQKRMYDMQGGGGKEGNTFEYDATKVKYYTDKQVEVFNRNKK